VFPVFQGERAASIFRVGIRCHILTAVLPDSRREGCIAWSETLGSVHVNHWLIFHTSTLKEEVSSPFDTFGAHSTPGYAKIHTCANDALWKLKICSCRPALCAGIARHCDVNIQHIQWVVGVLSLAIRRPGREADLCCLYIFKSCQGTTPPLPHHRVCISGNVAARSRNRDYSGNTTLRSSFVVEVNVTVYDTTVLSVVQKGFNDEFMSPATIQPI